MPARFFLHGEELERVAAGVYSDRRGGLHIVASELLIAFGYADTPENREILIAAAGELVRTKYRTTAFTVVD